MDPNPTSKTAEDLFKHALTFFQMDETTAREVLKRNNYSTFKKELWNSYMEILRTESLKLKQQRLEDLEKTLIKMIDPKYMDCWVWHGTPEALAAHWELENQRRDQDFKTWYRKRFWYLQKPVR